MEYGLIGEKLGHSFSKIIHGKLFGYEYELKELARDKVEEFFAKKAFSAINVTIPYKETVIPYLDEISDTAMQIGAVNTVINRDGYLYGDNTDFYGMMALIEYSGISLQEKNVLILGSGGTSKTALAVAKSLGAASAERVSRSDKTCINYTDALARKDTQIIINTTPCGMFPKIGESAIDVKSFPKLEGVIDAVYNPIRSKLVCDALELGIKAVGGLYMLVAQAVAAAELFVGKKVPVGKTEEIYFSLLAQKQNIVLIGMPSSGKTTVGKLIAEQCGLSFIDTDEEIVKQEGRQISEIFASDGEKAFRDIESAVIRRVSAMQGSVIATGGGAVLRKENVDLLRENGRIYFLDRPLQTLMPTEDRPLSSDRETLKKRYKERYSIYCGSCDCRIDSPKTPNEAADMIKEDAYGENFSD